MLADKYACVTLSGYWPFGGWVNGYDFWNGEEGGF